MFVSKQMLKGSELRASGGEGAATEAKRVHIGLWLAFVSAVDKKGLMTFM